MEKGDCPQRRYDPTTAYCYYHDKLRRGLLDPFLPSAYPYLPLPDDGYIAVKPAA